MWNNENEGLKSRIAHLSNQELLQMVNLDYEQYREEALVYARAEMERRGLKIEPVTFTAAETETAANGALKTEAANFEYAEPPTEIEQAEIEQEAAQLSQVEFKIFRGTWASWEQLFSEAAEFATGVGSLRLIGISHSSSQNDGVVTVWYWA